MNPKVNLMKQSLQKTIQFRQTEYPVHFLFPARWSPRSMSGEKIREDELMTLFEAARWAPSSYNNQPWRFLYALRGSAFWPIYLGFLEPFNRGWAEKAAALVILISKKVFEDGKPSKTHSFDSGSAWQNMSLQGFLSGLVVHGMEGFDEHKARAALDIPEVFGFEAMVAVGRPATLEALPASYREMETPSLRKPVSELAFEGGLPIASGRRD